MKKEFSTNWNSSVKPNKQRKFRFKAPLHIKGKFLNAHLSKDLKGKYNTRSIRLRVGDKVRILRGQFRRQEGKVEEVNVRKSIVFISKVEHTKRDGTKARYPIQASNVMITELNTDDKRRFKDSTKIAAKQAPKQAPATKQEKPVKDTPRAKKTEVKERK